MSLSAGRGDCGQTTLVDQTRAWKDDPRVAAAGDLDEFCSWLGVVAAHLPPGCDAQREQVLCVQQSLFLLGVVVQSGGGKTFPGPAPTGAEIDAWAADLNRRLHPVSGFIVPGGTPAAAFAHVARAVCRRAERRTASLLRTASGEAEENLQAVCSRLNRLGGWLFALARYANQAQGAGDVSVKQP